MILIKVECGGIKPSTNKQFLLRDNIDEKIFFNTFERINTKIDKGLRINLDEIVWLYCGVIIKNLSSDNNIHNLKEKISSLLSSNLLMIGVAEMIRKIRFEIKSNKHRSFSFQMTNFLLKE